MGLCRLGHPPEVGLRAGGRPWIQSLASSLPFTLILTLSPPPRHVRPGQRLLSPGRVGKFLFPVVLCLVNRVSSGALDQLSRPQDIVVLVGPGEQEVAIIQTPCHHRPRQRWETNPTELGACYLGDTRGVLWSGACLGRVEIHIRPFLPLKRTRDAPWASSGSGGRADMRPVNRMTRKAVCVECGSERETPPKQIQAAVPAEVPQGPYTYN